MRAHHRRQALVALPFTLLAACAGAPPVETPKPAPTTVAVAPPEPTATATVAAKAAPPPPLAIGSSFQADPLEPLPAGAVARCGTTRMRAASPKDVAVANNGTLWAVDALDMQWVLRDVTRGTDVATFPRSSEALFTPDASIVVLTSVGSSGVFSFFSVPDGKRLGDVSVPLPVKPGKGGALASLLADRAYVDRTLMSPDGTAMVATTSDGSVHVLDVAQHKLVKSIKAPPRSRLAGISRGGARGVFETTEKEANRFEALMSLGTQPLTGYVVMDLRTGAAVHKETFKKPPLDPAFPDDDRTPEHGRASFRLTPDGKRLFRLEGSNIATLDAATGKELSSARNPALPPVTGGTIGGFSGSLGGLMLGRGGITFEVYDDGSVLLEDDIIDVDASTALLHVGHDFAAISPDRSHVAYRRERVFEVSPDGPEVRPGHDDSVVSLAFLPDNRLASVARRPMVWSTDSCAPIRHDSFEARFAVTSPGRAVTFFGGSPGLLLDEGWGRRDTGEKGSVRAAAFAPDGETLFLGVGEQYGETARLVSIDVDGDATRKQEREFKMPFQSIAVSPDGALLAVTAGKPTGQDPDALMLLSAAGLSTTKEISMDRAGEVAFAGPDTLLLASSYRGVSVRATPSLDEVRRIRRGGCCDQIAVSPDGKLVAGVTGRTVFVWEIATRRLVGQASSGHREAIQSVAFSADGRHLATGSQDTTILLWELAKLTVPPPPSAVETRARGAAESASFIATHAESFHIKGDGTIAPAPGHEKVAAPPLKSVTQLVSGGRSHCAIAEGKVRCWGSTQGGALGIPAKRGARKWSYAEQTTPTTLPVKDPVLVRMDYGYACALERGGDLVCWGDLVSASSAKAPAKILGDVKSFGVAHDRACAVGKDGSLRCWSGDAAPAVLPVKDVAEVALGLQHMCVLTTAGTVQCKGENGHNQLGDDTGLDSKDFVPVKGLDGVTSITAYRFLTCAVTKAAGVQCWGDIADVELDHATRIPAFDGATEVRIDWSAVCARIGDRVDCLSMREKE